jgi:hypothetical protein
MKGWHSIDPAPRRRTTERDGSLIRPNVSEALHFFGNKNGVIAYLCYHYPLWKTVSTVAAAARARDSVPPAASLAGANIAQWSDTGPYSTSLYMLTATSRLRLLVSPLGPLENVGHHHRVVIL